MTRIVFLAYALTHAAILLRLLTARTRGPGMPIVAGVAAGLAYDNSLIAAGALIGAGPLLEALSWPRFALHAAFTPFIIQAAWQIAGAAGVPWTRRPGAGRFIWLVIAALATWGIGFDLAGLELQPACLGDTLRYTSSTPPPQFCDPGQVSLPGHGPPVPSIATVIACLLLGIAVWRFAAWPWLSIAAMLMFIAAALPASQLGPLTGNGGEVILLTGLAASTLRFARERSRGR